MMIFNILHMITYILLIVLISFTLFTSIRDDIKFRAREKEFDEMIKRLKADIDEIENKDPNVVEL